MEKLYRSRNDRIIGGVSGGIAEIHDWDPAVVRIITALIVLFTGVGLAIYLIWWAVVPLKPIHRKKVSKKKRRTKKFSKKRKKS